MNGNFQYNYRGGWNNVPSTDSSQGQIPHDSGRRAFADNWHIPHQMPAQYADNRHIPHQMPARFADNRHIPHQAPAHYADNRHIPHQAPKYFTDNRHLPHPTPPYYADNVHLPHPTLTHYADNMHLPHPTPPYYAHNVHLSHPKPTHCDDNRHLPHPTLRHYDDNRHLPRPMPTHYADNRNLPQPMPAHYADMRHLPHQTVEKCADNRHLPHQTVEKCADNRHLPHQAPIHYEDKMCLPHQTAKDLADKMHLPNQNSEDYAANKCLPHKTPDHYADKRQLPQQTSDAYTDKRQLPQQMSEAYAGKRQLPHQTPKDCADKNLSQQTPKDCADKNLSQETPEDCADKNLSQQTPKDCADKNLSQQTPEDCADKNLSQQTPEDCADKNLSQQTPEDCADKNLSQQTPEDCADKNLSQQTPKDCADKNLSQQTPKDCADKCLPQQTPEDCANKKCLPQQTPEDCANKKCLPQQTPKDCAKKKCSPPLLHCEICDLNMNPKCMESHNKGKKHRRRFLKLRERAMKKSSNGKEIRHNQSSQISKEANADKKGLLQQTPKDFANKRPLPHQKSEAYADNKCLPRQMSKHHADKKNSSQQVSEDHANKKCLAPMIQCEVCDIKLNPKCLKDHNNGKKHQRRLLELREKSMKHKEVPVVQINPVVQPKEVPRSRDHTGAKDHDFKVENVKNETSSFKKNKVPAEMSKRKVRDNNDAKDHGFKHEIEEATGGKYMKMNNGIRRFVQSSKPEVNDLSNSVKSLVQIPESTPPSGHVASSKIAPILAEGSSFELQSQHVSASLSQESKGKKYHKFQNTTVEKNDQPQSTPVELNASASSNIIAETEYISCDSNNQQHSISMELQDISGSMTNNQTEVVRPDSTPMETYVEPLASLPSDAVGSRFEPVTEHGLETETEPHVAEAILYIESQHPTEETDIELPPPILMEVDVALEVSAETETKDGSSRAEVKMDVDLSPELGKTKLPKLSVCLTCGDEGFEEAIVYCSKCGDYAMHRYCLAGPVVFTDKVTWFCEDCEEVVVEADHPNSETLESKKDEVVDPQPIADPIWRGSLQVFNKSFDKITSLMGHLSTLACPKVLQETRHLPDVLYANLLQRSAVWPESFKKFGTNNQSIALYFFPENERAERYFDQLVDDIVSNDLAIRVMVEKAELLIFPSTLLPSQYKRFGSKYYLWGIFKRKQAASTIKDR